MNDDYTRRLDRIERFLSMQIITPAEAAKAEAVRNAELLQREMRR